MHAEPRNASVEPQKRSKLLEVTWQDINEPGAYVEVGSGDLYRIPNEALIAGSSPLIRKEMRWQLRDGVIIAASVVSLGGIVYLFRDGAATARDKVCECCIS